MATSQNQYIKCVAVGDPVTGKTSLFLSYAEGHFVDIGYRLTVFDNYTKATVIDGVSVTLAMWDTSGAEDYDRLRSLTYPETDVFLIFFSVSEPSTFENVLTKWYPEVRRCMPNTPVILVGMKADSKNDPGTLRHLLSRHKEPIKKEEAEAMGAEIGASAYVECSARRMQGVDDVFIEAVKAVWKKNPPKQKKKEKKTKKNQRN